MRGDVPVQFALAHERLVAYVAGVRPGAAVHAHVQTEAFHVRESLVADVARVSRGFVQGLSRS